ncbi:MAG: 23S rRNA (adenine(2503)-C(2))-methyltransferase RlmN [Candidatus Palauibacterales bacterium]|nr:23S rRNA (adenine(2503)-C(2))-methyltransferase RlmN [Candidatus Palauibacterales bacterium]MDP2529496.1 23S rRNA (adenine(2503)-C(2))-methyltransferase RlmN [Candidatus Palauibacterales bacterium]MDP2585156.1 23S rRNA (adenine(2503)-C(2))-methyltransferase RlmN [Candidatus Palauibacterales bacterium]
MSQKTLPETTGPAALLGLAPQELRRSVTSWLEARGEPAYRTDQVEHWVYGQAARSFDEATTLPTELRAELGAAFRLTPLEAAWTARSSDGTVKHLWRLEDGEQVESVLIPAGDRLTLCLSSQVGCALGCRFCATGSFGFRRHLTAAEIVAQYRDSLRFAREEMGRPITNLVFMGMGEPLANPEPLFAALEVLHEGFGVGARRITVSTVGLVPGILELARRPEPFGLAVSLHAPLSELRAALMPIERRYPLPELLAAVREYLDRKGRRVTFEYTLIEGINDSTELADSLADITSDLMCFINLIPWNPIPDRPWRSSPPERVEAFARALHRRGVSAAVREPRGRDIAAACGQLRLEHGDPAS